MDLVQEFVDATADLGPSEPFRRWGGMLLTSCLLGRRVRTSIKRGSPIHPNLFVLLVAPSGYGKTTIVNAVRGALRPYAVPAQENARPSVILCSTEISTPFLLHALGNAFPEPGKEDRAECFGVLADEPGNFFGTEVTKPQVSTLTKVWDCEDMVYTRATLTGQRQKDTPSAWSPYMSGVWGCQPAWLATGFPDFAWGMGLPARMVCVISDQPVPLDVSFEEDAGEDLADLLLPKLFRSMEEVRRAKGFFGWAPDARPHLTAWIKAGLPRRDGGTDWAGQKLDAYAQRRVQHFCKAATIIAAARHPRHSVISLADFTDAREMLWDADDHLPQILSVVGANPDLAAENEVVEWVRAQGEVHEAEVRNLLRHRVRGTLAVKGQLEELVASGQLVVADETVSPPHRRFRAGA